MLEISTIPDRELFSYAVPDTIPTQNQGLESACRLLLADGRDAIVEESLPDWPRASGDGGFFDAPGPSQYLAVSCLLFDAGPEMQPIREAAIDSLTRALWKGLGYLARRGGEPPADFRAKLLCEIAEQSRRIRETEGTFHFYRFRAYASLRKYDVVFAEGYEESRLWLMEKLYGENKTRGDRRCLRVYPEGWSDQDTSGEMLTGSATRPGILDNLPRLMGLATANKKTRDGYLWPSVLESAKNYKADVCRRNRSGLLMAAMAPIDKPYEDSKGNVRKIDPEDKKAARPDGSIWSDVEKRTYKLFEDEFKTRPEMRRIQAAALSVLGDDLLDGTSCFSKGIRKPKTRNLYAENGRFIGDHYLVEAICEHEKVTAETARKWLAEHAASLREILNQAQCLTKGRETKCL